MTVICIDFPWCAGVLGEGFICPTFNRINAILSYGYGSGDVSGLSENNLK